MPRPLGISHEQTRPYLTASTTTMAPNTADHDIIINKINLQLAKNQRLLASWLPPKSEADMLQDAKTEEEREKEDLEIFGTPMPELFVE